MAGAEERCGTTRGESRSTGDYLGATFIGLAVAVIMTAQAPAASAQEPPATPAPAAPGGGDQGGGNQGAAPAPGDQGGAPTNGTAAAPGGGPPTGPAWIITPAITATQSFTDNVLSTATDRKADTYTTLSPSISISGQSARLQGLFNYSPQAILYANTTSQDQILENLFSNGTLTAIPNLLFFDGSASISNSSRFGNQGFNSATQVPTSQSVQTTAYTGSPYVQLHFGDWGSAEARYSFSQTIFGGNTGATTDPTTGQSLGAIANSMQQVGTFKYNTGERFARVQFGFLSSYSQINSGDSALNSKDVSDTVNGTYLVTKTWSALFGGGYERLIYAEQAPLNFTGPTWDVGFSYHPREDRLIQLTYGEQQGQDALNGTMNYALTARTSAVASYSEATTNQQQQILQNLSGATQFTPGVTVNQQTGLPQPLVNPNLALQNSILRVKNLQAGLLLNNDRNHYSVSFDRNQQNSLTGGGLNQTSNAGIVSWGRDLTPNSTGALTASYASTLSNGSGTGTAAPSTLDVLTLGASFAFNFSPTLTGGASYSLSRQTGGTGGSVLVDIVAFTLRKTF